MISLSLSPIHPPIVNLRLPNASDPGKRGQEELAGHAESLASDVGRPVRSPMRILRLHPRIVKDKGGRCLLLGEDVAIVGASRTHRLELPSLGVPCQ